MQTDYILERTLQEKAPELHRNFRDVALICHNILTRFRRLFPQFTDHSDLHSLTVIDACNRLIGTEQIKKLNADEIYILLVAAYLHDVGMGIGEKEYKEFKDRLGEAEYFAEHPGAERADFVRDRHNEFSGLFIEKYADMFDIPSPAHTFAIRQVIRGHRKTDLFDEKEYPVALPLPNGNTVCTPYLAALVRLADEVDVVATRNPLLLYELGALTKEKSRIEIKKLESLKKMDMDEESFTLYAWTDDEVIQDALGKMAVKMQETLDTCRGAVAERTPFTITQKNIILKINTL